MRRRDRSRHSRRKIRRIGIEGRRLNDPLSDQTNTQKTEGGISSMERTNQKQQQAERIKKYYMLLTFLERQKQSSKKKP